MHTPGHARGHLCFHEESTGTLISGDNIVGLGSVLIDPPEGNMHDYLESLRRMRALPNLSVIFGGHGPAIANPYTKLDEYISHRLEREQKFSKLCSRGRRLPRVLLPRSIPMSHPKRMRWLNGRCLLISKSSKQTVAFSVIRMAGAP